MRVSRRHVIIVSPFLLTLVCRSAEKVAGTFIGDWAWVPAVLLFWAAIGTLVFALVPSSSRTMWFAPARGWTWSLLALGVGLLSLREFVHDWQVLGSASIAIPWFLFGIINPWFEESYWRGALIDATRSWPFGLGVIYSTAAFVLSHPAIWGVRALVLREPVILGGLAFAGIIWGIAYVRTGSLRWTIAGHTLANLLGLAVPMFMNMHVPSVLR